jgi:tetratricopeptide (TPR) repeat protein
MVPFSPDWRWLLEREDSPWYPTMRLFRQPALDDWDSVVKRLRSALGELTRQQLPEWRPASEFDPRKAFDAAMAHFHAGRMEAVEAVAAEIVAHAPAHAGAHHLLGIVAINRGQYQQAVDFLRRSIALDATQSRVHNNLGIALSGLRRPEEAIECFRQAVTLEPRNADAQLNLGKLLHQQKKLNEAAEAFERAIAAKPDHLAALLCLAVISAELGKRDQEVACFRRAVALDPNNHEHHYNLGTALQAQGALAEAADCYQRALAIKPNHTPSHFNLGNLHQSRGNFVDSVASFERAIVAKPDFASAHWNAALALLRLGRFEEGWREYGWRWSRNTGIPKRHADKLLWDGSDLDGKTLLVHAEQGFGDTIQFARYLPAVVERGGKVILEVQRSLAQLIGTMAKGFAVVTEGDVLPPFDVQCPLLTLPGIFGTTLQSIPNAVPYLSADPLAVQHWKQTLGSAASLRVGLAWAGDPTHKNDRNRSVPFAILAPLLKRNEISWFSLQVGKRAADISEAPAGSIMDLSAKLTDFFETAAAMACLDLIITADTAVAHLAGALGKPAWILLPFVADWRWLVGRHDSPWYPNALLFRQSKDGDWSSVISAVQGALATMTRKARKDSQRGIRRVLETCNDVEILKIPRRSSS